MNPTETTTEPPETVLDELTDTQKRMRAIIVEDVRALLWSEIPKIVQRELGTFFKPFVDIVKYAGGLFLDRKK